MYSETKVLTGITDRFGVLPLDQTMVLSRNVTRSMGVLFREKECNLKHDYIFRAPMYHGVRASSLSDIPL